MNCAFVKLSENENLYECTYCGRRVSSRHSADKIFANCLSKASRCLPGTALKALLSWFRIDVGRGCACKNRAAQMDRWGCDESERRIEHIVGWLREEARKRRLPFANIVGRMLVRLAIRNARKAARN